jgi:hypothetical protein
MLLIELGPEQRDERIAPMEPTGCGSGEIGEQRYALRLGDDRSELASISFDEAYRSQNTELDHWGPRDTAPRITRGESTRTVIAP